jgi:pyridoxal phosphate enzyme (YggS family)
MIADNVKKILEELPEGVRLVAAAKTRTAGEILEAIDAGVEIVGQNYVQEAEAAYGVVGKRARWHFIGHLQKNKVKKAVLLFDMIETLDSLELAREIDKRAAQHGLTLPALIEINSGREPQKFGVMPEEVEELAGQVASLEHVRIQGVMTMGPYLGDPEDARPYFVETRRVFERLGGSAIPGVEMTYLSMGMTNSYRVAIEEGANLVRIGTKIFGPR